MVKEIVLIILLFNGEMLLKPYNLIIGSSIRSHLGGTVHECFEYGDQLRNELSNHTWNYKNRGPMSHGWYLKDGSGTFQGFICMI